MKETQQTERMIDHYKSIIDMIHAGINLIDKDGKIIYVNDSYCNMHGYKKEELIGKSLDLILPGQNRNDALNQYKKIINKEINRPYTVEGMNVRRDGSAFPVIISWNYLLKDGILDGMVTVIQDLSEIKAVEKALNDSEKRYKSLVENISDFIWEIDATGKYKYVSPISKDLYLYTQEEMCEKIIWDNIIDKDDSSRMLLEEVIIAKKPFSHIEIIKKRKDGEIIVVETSGIPVFSKNNEFKGYWGTDRDITAQKKVEEIYQEIEILKSKLKKREYLEYIMGDSAEIRTVHKAVERVAKTDFSVIISGETGSGKEIISNAIHSFSKRENKPLISIDCGAIPESLIESELFGCVKGAFTGATETKDGAFQQANEGSIFLDEITNLSLEMQKKLLRVLQERVVNKIGSTQKEKLDIRIIAASNEDILGLVDAGKFRKDLYFRLNEFSITIPPLRSRPDDIPILVQRFSQEISAQLKTDRVISKEAMRVLCEYSWPGNVRELKNVIKKAFIISEREINSEHFDFIEANENKNENYENIDIINSIDYSNIDLKKIVKEYSGNIEKRIIEKTINKFKGNKSKSAKFLNIDYKTILQKIKDYDIGL